jgi:hypothetical protein
MQENVRSIDMQRKDATILLTYSEYWYKEQLNSTF